MNFFVLFRCLIVKGFLVFLFIQNVVVCVLPIYSTGMFRFKGTKNNETLNKFGFIWICNIFAYKFLRFLRRIRSNAGCVITEILNVKTS